MDITQSSVMKTGRAAAVPPADCPVQRTIEIKPIRGRLFSRGQSARRRPEVRGRFSGRELSPRYRNLLSPSAEITNLRGGIPALLLPPSPDTLDPAAERRRGDLLRTQRDRMTRV